MQDFMYSTIGVIGLIVHIIINPSLFQKSSYQTKQKRAYTFLMLAIFVYYLTDAFWGFFAGLNNIPLLFLDTTLYFVAMASAVLCWTDYIIDYLAIKSRWGKALKSVAWIFFGLDILMLTLNFFVPCFFWFDENDAYQGGVVRYSILWIQVVLFFITVLITGVKARQISGTSRKRYLAIFLFSIVMVVANVFQILYPLLPVYAMGCLIGCSILHVYVIEDEREEYRRIIDEEKNLAEAASRAKTSFLFYMSHDIRTPMNAILGYTSMAQKKTEDETVNGYLSKIDIAGNQLLSLVNQVLEMSRIESGKVILQKQKIDLEENAVIVRTIYEETAKAKGLSFHVELGDLPYKHLIGDQDRISQIMNNLLGNAIKYTPDGGSILNRVTEEPCDQEGTVVLCMTVEDTGIGMSEEYLPHVFEEFSREQTSTVNHIQGTGLGMSIVKKLVVLMNGTIDVTSKLNAGTKFVVRIPMLIDDELTQKRVPEEKKEEISLEGMKILLVEDNEMNREIAIDILTDAGAQVDTAEDGIFAVEKVRNSVPGDYDVVLMDIQMPRMNGYEATAQIRSLENKELAGICIIAMTANAFAEDRKNALDAGMNGHLAKPIDVDILLNTLSKIKK